MDGRFQSNYRVGRGGLGIACTMKLDLRAKIPLGAGGEEGMTGHMVAFKAA